MGRHALQGVGLVQLDLSTHISHAFNEDLTRIRGLTLEMGRMVEEQIGASIKALVTGGSHLARRVKADDLQVNRLEVRIDNECSRLIVRRQSAAMDLRYVLAIIKITSDLERISDETEKVSRMVVKLSEMPRPRDNYQELGDLGSRVKGMVCNAITAFETYNARMARDVLRRDQAVDRDYDGISGRYITAMSKAPRDIRRILYLLWLARALERIGDHAKNVSEQVLNFIEGMDVRHGDQIIRVN